MISTQTPLEVFRPPTGTCLGAVFCTYAFDEDLFSSVLAALLPIHADPESDTRYFLMEARRRLRETPVVVLADGNSYAGGHQLPFDLLLSDRNTAFFARLALLLFDDHARLVVGSANLTRSGLGESADLCAALQLDYRTDAALLREILVLLAAAGARGEGWTRFERQCQAMTGPPGKAAASPRLLASDEQSVLEQFLAGVPKSARINEAHIMLPTQPEDDARSGASVLSPLHQFLRTRAKKAHLHVAVAWADASVVPPPARQITEPEQLAGYLCAETQGPPGAETIRWHAIERVANNKLFVAHNKAPLLRKAVARVMQGEPPRAWAVEEVTGVGLLDAIEPFLESFDTSWWLFPEVQLSAGRVQRRPFHGRALALCTTERGKPVTHLLLGAPNFERQLAKGESLFEVGLHLRIARAVPITELCAPLVPAPTEGFFLEDRSWLSTDLRVVPPLERATYDARTHQLKLEWRHRAPECRLTYQRDTGEEELFKGRPGLHTSVPDLVLAHGSTELRVAWDDHQALVPIEVHHTAHLRADEPEHTLTLKELVALHSNQQQVAKADRRLSAQDVFATHHGLVDMLGSTGRQLSAFEVAMEGPVGVRAYADRLLQGEECDQVEAWLFGLDLCQLLRGMSWRGDPFGAEKKQTVNQLLAEIEARLAALAPTEPWTADVARYFGAGA